MTEESDVLCKNLGLGLTLLDPGCVKLARGNLKLPPFWNGSALWSHVLWLLVFRYYSRSLKKMGRVVLGLCGCDHIVPEPIPQLKIQDIGFAAITGWIPTTLFMNSFVDTNKCALVYSFWQYYNLSMVK